MYTRINSNRLPMVVLKTENNWSIASDKSGVNFLGFIGEKSITLGPIRADKHGVHILVNQALGQHGITVILPDYGDIISEVKLSKAQLEAAADLDWHFRACIVRIDLPADV